jgi:hypothetical protein
MDIENEIREVNMAQRIEKLAREYPEVRRLLETANALAQRVRELEVPARESDASRYFYATSGWTLTKAIQALSVAITPKYEGGVMVWTFEDGSKIARTNEPDLIVID